MAAAMAAIIEVEAIMFNAMYFSLDGIYSGVYGLRIASFADSGGVEESPFLSPTLNITNSSRSKRFYFGGRRIENAPQKQMSIISDRGINDINRREILSWLYKPGFRELLIHQSDYEWYKFRVAISDINVIYFSALCVGFSMTLNFDSIYGTGKPTVVKATLDGTEKTVKLLNKSDNLCQYTMPTLKFTNKVSAGELTIRNNSDTSLMEFELTDLRNNEVVTIDNELQLISSSANDDILSYFNKRWLRLKPGMNELAIKGTGDIEITCPTYALLGF